MSQETSYSDLCDKVRNMLASTLSKNLQEAARAALSNINWNDLACTVLDDAYNALDGETVEEVAREKLAEAVAEAIENLSSITN